MSFILQLKRCDESDSKDVYEISLRAEQLVKIENLDEVTFFDFENIVMIICNI